MAYEGLELQSCAFLTSALDGSDGHLHAPAVLSAKNEPLDALTSRMGEPHCRSGSFRGGEDLLTVLEIRTNFVGLPGRSLVITPTALPQPFLIEHLY
jgi:hypothetical protein